MAWYGNQFLRRFEQRMQRNVKRACVHANNEIKHAISEPYPPVSAPGSPPHMRTGELRRNQLWEANGHIGKVGNLKKYSTYLEGGTGDMEARPFIESTVEEHKEEIKRLLQE